MTDDLNMEIWSRANAVNSEYGMFCVLMVASLTLILLRSLPPLLLIEHYLHKVMFSMTISSSYFNVVRYSLAAWSVCFLAFTGLIAVLLDISDPLDMSLCSACLRS
jgi:hypothetical protein